MKNTAYIALMIMLAALTACQDSDDIQHVRQDRLDIKTFPITSLTDPRLLPDGSIVTLEADNSTSGSSATYRIVKLSKDGSITKSTGLSFHFEDGGMPEGRRLDFEGSDHGFTFASDGEASFTYTTQSDFAVAKTGAGVALDISVTNHLPGQFIGGVPLDDGSYAVVTANDRVVLSVMDGNGGISRQSILPYLLYNNAHSYKIFGICGNIMIIDISAAPKEFYVYSPDGQYLNFGTYGYLFDNIVCIADPTTNKFSHAYAITSEINFVNSDGKTVEGSIITKLDPKGCIIYEYMSLEHSEIYNVAEHDGKLIVAGYYMSNYGDNFTLSDVFSAATSTTGKIVIIDAETSDEISTHILSLEGGVLPFAAVPDGIGGFYIYMARIFSSEISEMGTENQYGSSIYIYHIDDLSKLNIE